MHTLACEHKTVAIEALIAIHTLVEQTMKLCTMVKCNPSLEK